MLDRRLATFVQWVRRHIFLFCSPLISLCWKIDLANIEGALISNENIFFHFNLIHRRENIQTSALGKNTRCLQSGQARWLGPDCYMLGLCRYLQMNCTANSSISNSLFGLNKRRFILFLPSEKEKSLCLICSFKNILVCSSLMQQQPHFLPAARHCSLIHSTASGLLHTTCPMLGCQDWILPLLTKRPEKTFREWLCIPRCCFFSPKTSQHVHRTCVCVRESGLGWLASRKAKMCQSGQRELEMKLQFMCQMPMKLNDFSSPERCHSASHFNHIGKGNTSTNSRRATMLLELMDVIKWYV